MREAYILVRRCRFSYEDVKKMDREERQYFLSFLKEEIIAREESMNEAKQRSRR